MSLLDYINPFNRVMNVVDELVEDKDKANKLKYEIDKGYQETVKQKEESYQIALQQKTVPWLDGIHKMGRQMGTYLGYGLCFYMVHQGVTDPLSLAACFAPGTAYNFVKGSGKK